MAEIYSALITRFSVPALLASRRHRKDKDLTYLRRRFRLFNTFCLPSIRAQTQRYDVWFLLMGSNTPDTVREYLANIPEVTPIYSDAFAKSLHQVRDWIEEESYGKPILTTRIDNDDGLAAQFTGNLFPRAELESEYPVYFDYIDGIQMKATSLRPHAWQAYKKAYTANPFVSMLEEGGKRPQLVYNCPHGSVRNGKRTVRHIRSQPMWLQVIHGGNLQNGIWSRTKTNVPLDRFTWMKPYFRDALTIPGKVEI